MGPDGALSSDEVNILIYRYLIEAGFSHSAFVFGCESTVTKVNIDGKDIPIGALVAFIQKGFQFMELEANLNEQGTDVYGKYFNLTASDILTKDLKELREMAREFKLDESDDAINDNTMTTLTTLQPSSPAQPKITIQLPHTSLKPFPNISSEINSLSWSPSTHLLALASADGITYITNLVNGQSTECIAKNTSTSSNNTRPLVAVEWSPDGNFLASADDEGTIYLWKRNGEMSFEPMTSPSMPPSSSSSRSLLALQWSTSGTFLASGYADGTLLIWNPSQSNVHTVFTYQEDSPIHDIHWKNDEILAAATHQGVILVYSIHEKYPIVISRDQDGDDASMEDATPLSHKNSHLPGSINQVNMIRWNGPGNMVASASNDMTVGFWSIPSEPSFGSNTTTNTTTTTTTTTTNTNADMIHSSTIKTGHKREVNVVAWSPPLHINSTSTSSSSSFLLASGSSDGSIRLWHAEKKECIGILDRHEDGITCMAWSPSGEYIASGDGQGNVTIWNVSMLGTGEVCIENSNMIGYKYYKGQGAVGNVQWVDGGKRVAISLVGSHHVAGILDLE